MRGLYPGSGSSYAWSNVAVAGETLTQMIAEVSAEIAPRILAGRRCIVIVSGGTNDLSNSATGQQVYDRYVAYAQAVKALGCRVIVTTIKAAFSGAGGFDTRRQDANTLLRADHSFADGFADPAGAAQLSDYTDLAYFDADQIHNNNAGYAVWASIVKPAIDAVLLLP